MNQKINDREVALNKWSYSSIAVAKAITLLSLIRHIYYKIKRLLQGRLIICIDNFTNYKDIHRDYVKAIERASDRVLLIVEIKKLFKMIMVTIGIGHRIIKKKKVVKFEDNLPLFLLQECNAKSKVLRMKV